MFWNMYLQICSKAQNYERCLVNFFHIKAIFQEKNNRQYFSKKEKLRNRCREWFKISKILKNTEAQFWKKTEMFEKRTGNFAQKTHYIKKWTGK